MPDPRPPGRRRIVFVHGRKPKPPAGVYRNALWRCLLEGVRRADPSAAERLADDPDCFLLAQWSDLFYSHERDFELDREAIETLLTQDGAAPADREEAENWTRRVKRLIYSVGDRFPWLVERFADTWIRETVADTRRYLENRDGLAVAARERVAGVLDQAASGADGLLVLGHSLGSVVVYDVLWQMTHERGHAIPVDWFVTLGSPLGTQFIQRNLLGHEYRDERRFPRGIRHWRNFTARGDLAALDPDVYDDFEPMLELGLLETLADHGEPIYGSFRNRRGLNVHRSYGYLVQPAVGRVVAEWIRTRG